MVAGSTQNDVAGPFAATIEHTRKVRNMEKCFLMRDFSILGQRFTRDESSREPAGSPRPNAIGFDLYRVNWFAFCNIAQCAGVKLCSGLDSQNERQRRVNAAANVDVECVADGADNTGNCSNPLR